MSGHVSWALVKAQQLWENGPEERALNQQQVAYVQGYILALEDVLGDMEKIPYTNGHDSLSDIEQAINTSLREARETLTNLTQEKKC